MGDVEIINGDGFAQKIHTPVVDGPVEQLEAHEGPELIDLIQAVGADLRDVDIGPIHGFPVDVLVGEEDDRSGRHGAGGGRGAECVVGSQRQRRRERWLWGDGVGRGRRLGGRGGQGDRGRECRGRFISCRRTLRFQAAAARQAHQGDGEGQKGKRELAGRDHGGFYG